MPYRRSHMIAVWVVLGLAVAFIVAVALAAAISGGG